MIQLVKNITTARKEGVLTERCHHTMSSTGPVNLLFKDVLRIIFFTLEPQTLDHLEDNIRRVIADIQPQMLEKVIENWTTSEPAVAVLHQKSYLKCNATRLSFE
ncbi:hypothetical protein TNCV_2406991 [Trichonephila clavipes]|nr:hypothetical protein TNCV_2406991 [Trichonephila clavipes]